MGKILLAEDDIDLGAILKQFLELNNFFVVWAKNGEEALELFKVHKFDLCILDVMMPKKDGFTLAEEIVENYPETLFFFVTAKVDINDRLKGLKLGAIDYITKPFDTNELILKIKNLIQRKEACFTVENFTKLTDIVQIGLYSFDSKNLELTIKDSKQRLTEKETLLISYFYNNKNLVCKRDDILNAVWGTDDFFTGRSMDVFISRLRKYFEQDPRISIKSLRGIGFEFLIDTH